LSSLYKIAYYFVHVKRKQAQMACGVGYSIMHYLVVAGAMLGNIVEAPKPKIIEVPKPKIDMKRSPFFVLLAPNISWNINNAVAVLQVN